MRVLFYGAGPIGSIYAHLIHQATGDVTVLARGERLAFLKANGLVVRNEITGEEAVSEVHVIDQLRDDDAFDLVVVCMRKSRLPAVFDALANKPGIQTLLFMGNNALGFDAYLNALPAEKVLIGFPGAGGGISEQVVHYADREQPGGKRRAITIGELDGVTRERTIAVRTLFESAGVPVDITEDIDGWLKYHAALICPLAGALYKHDCNSVRVSEDPQTLKLAVRAAKECGRVLEALGFERRQPFRFNLFYWLPEAFTVLSLKQMLASKFGEIAFSLHARAARDELQVLACEFQQLATQTDVETPAMSQLNQYTAGHA